MTAFPVIFDGVDSLAGLQHAVSRHFFALGASCLRAAVFTSRVLSFSSKRGVVEAEGVAALTYVELDGSRH